MNIQTAIVLATFAVAGNAAELSMGNGILNPAAQPLTLNVALTSSGASLTGMQFDLEYDAGALNVTVVAGPATGSAGKNLQSNVLQAGHLRILIVGMNQTTIADGAVATLQVSLKGQAGAGKTFPIRMTAPAGTNAKAQAVALSAGSGSVKVETQR
jgi:Cohesin domain